MAKKPRRTFFKLMILLAIVGVVFVALAAFRAGPEPTITITSDLPAIGKKTLITIELAEHKRGLSKVGVEFVQGDRVELLESMDFVPRPPWVFWGPYTPTHQLSVAVGREVLQGLKEGEATIRVTADRTGAYLRFPEPTVREMTMQVKLRPPQLQVLSRQTYVAQGGCEAIVYRVGASAIRDGVQAGDWWFPGFPLPGGDPQERFALFSLPYDMSDPDQVNLLAFDDVDNQSRMSFIDKVFPKPVKRDTIRIDDAFMSRVVPAIIEQTPELTDKGDLLANYLLINNTLRKQNADELIRLSRESTPEFLWTRRFLPMKNAQVTSAFADRRTYVYQGNKVDQQDHLGFDLASTRRAEVQAANDGTVVLARYFGIYGNAVVIDHGYGLFSLYGHLSQIDVGERQQVSRGEILGRTGRTGLAGGDHLHFTVLLQGLAVNPTEWWDEHWIRDRLELKLGDALPFE